MPRLSIRGAFAAALLSVQFACARSATMSGGTAASPNAKPADANPTAAAAAGAPTSGMAGMDHASHQTGGHTSHQMGAATITIPAGAGYTEADVRFMQGMIAHHGQAVHMSRMALSHGASPRLVRFAQKIDQGQLAEIRLMQEWLVANTQEAPTAESWRSMMMPGMLTTENLKQLDAARGVEFDRLFLTFMIRHHEGAIAMVNDLFASPRAGQDVDVNVFANDVVSVQSAEIALMRQMLEELAS